MGLLNFFRRKKPETAKIDVADIPIVSKSVDDYFETLKRYKFLKKIEVQNIPDEKLETAVMSWMWQKVDEDWDHQLEIIESLPKPCQDIYSCRTVVDEINNGGINQLFFNSTGQFAPMSVAGFSALGSEKLSDLMSRAIEIFVSSKPVLEQYNDGTMESFMDSYLEELWGSMDDDFYAECEASNLSDKNIAYIRQNANCFGD